MTFKPPLSRPAMRSDLTRWNRAGLTRIDYVDGNAALWLEELRIALLGLYLRGAGTEKRVPEYWRDVFMKAKDDWPDAAALNEAAADILWKRLLVPTPEGPETAPKRNQRLVDQYRLPTDEYGWEIARAFARAAHVLLGHLNAFANEGYLRTATQWENVRRLASMVNYQPRPAASAVSTVALIVDPAKGMAVIDRGLAMKFAPPKVAPLVYETLEPVVAHPDLNAARGARWNVNNDDLEFPAATQWLAASGEGLVPGAPCAVYRYDATTNALTASATALTAASWNETAGTAALTLAPNPAAGWTKHDTTLLAAPDGVLVGQPISDANVLVLECSEAASFGRYTVVRVIMADGASFLAVVLGGKDGFLRLAAAPPPAAPARVERLVQFAASGGFVLTPLDIFLLYFRASGGDGVVPSGPPTPETVVVSTTNVVTHNKFTVPVTARGDGFAIRPDDQSVSVKEVRTLPEVVQGVSLPPDGRVRFAGKPPKTLAAGDWFVARQQGTASFKPLRVEGIRKEEGTFLIQFHDSAGTPPDATEFHGRMNRSLRPVGFDCSTVPAFSGPEAILEGLSAQARDLLKPGRAVIVARDTAAGIEAAELDVVSFEADSSNPTLTKVTFEFEADLHTWMRGETQFHFNTAAISHGETKPPKTLGSGDGAQSRQSFPFKAENVSFTPNSAAEAGVAPDMDVTVDGVKWQYRDYIDQDAEDLDAWSTTLNDDGTLTIHFRRRLPNGTDNVAVARYRSGVGTDGNAAAPFSFDKPMKKHANVTAILQPFALAGGAAREPVSAMRVNAPARMAANGRAVSLEDFARLCRRNANVWRARAERVIEPGTANHVLVTIVPAGGGSTIPPKLEGDLRDFLAARMLPGTVVSLAPYQPLTIRFDATLRVDVSRFEKNDVRRKAAAALAAQFALATRDLGQPIFAAQALAGLQSVEGVATAVLTGFTITNGNTPERKAQTGGAVAAYFPWPNQVAFVASPEDIKLTMETA
jgi:hypothetical protein